MNKINTMQCIRLFFVSITCAFGCTNTFATESGEFNLRSISPFSLGSLCQAAEIVLNSVASGDAEIIRLLDGLEIYKNQKVNGTCGGMKSLYPWLNDETIDKHRKSISISVPFEHGEIKERGWYDRGRLGLTADNNGIIQEISMHRRWRISELGPRRKEMLERLVSKYGEPAVFHTDFFDDSEYTIRMIWGSTFQQSPEFKEKGKQTISTNDIKKEYTRLGCKIPKSIDAKSTEAWTDCYTKAFKIANKPIDDVLNFEKDVLVNAYILVNKQSDTVLQIQLSTKNVPGMRLMEELDKKKQIEKEKKQEEERSKSIPKF